MILVQKKGTDDAYVENPVKNIGGGSEVDNHFLNVCEKVNEDVSSKLAVNNFRLSQEDQIRMSELEAKIEVQ